MNKELLKALFAFQQEVKPIFKGTTGYGYRYSDLTEIDGVIKPLLTKHGLGYIQPLRENKVETILYHAESGEQISSIIEIPTNVTLKGMNDFQVLGSGITYLRRYSLSSLLGLITDADLDATGKQYESIEEIKADYDNKLITQAQATKAKEEIKNRQNGTK